MYLYIIRIKAKGTGQVMTISWPWVMTSNHVTYPAVSVFFFTERQDDTKCSGLFTKFAFFYIFGPSAGA